MGIPSNSSSSSNNAGNNNNNHSSPYSMLMDDDDEFGIESRSRAGSLKGSAEMPVSGAKGQCGQLADRVLFSTAYFVGYIFVIISNFVLIIWLIVMMSQKKFETRGHWAFIILDLFVNCAFVAEISLQIISQKKHYFEKYSNLFDFAIMLLSILSLCVYFTREGVAEQVEDLLALGLLGIRYALQFLRLVTIIRRQRALHSTRKGVDFSQLKPEDFHFIEDPQARA